MNDPGILYWSGTLFWAASGFVLGWVLGRLEKRTNYLLAREKEKS